MDSRRSKALRNLGWWLWLFFTPLNAFTWYFAHANSWHLGFQGSSSFEREFWRWADGLTGLAAVGSFIAGWILLGLYGRSTESRDEL